MSLFSKDWIISLKVFIFISSSRFPVENKSLYKLTVLYLIIPGNMRRVFHAIRSVHLIGSDRSVRKKPSFALAAITSYWRVCHSIMAWKFAIHSIPFAIFIGACFFRERLRIDFRKFSVSCTHYRTWTRLDVSLKHDLLLLWRGVSALLFGRRLFPGCDGFLARLNVLCGRLVVRILGPRHLFSTT